MGEHERRRQERTAEAFPVSIATTELQTLEGQTVNLSTKGVLLMARGSLTLSLRIKGEEQ